MDDRTSTTAIADEPNSKPTADAQSPGDRLLSGPGVLDAALPEEVQTALGRLLGGATVETLEDWVTEVHRRTDGPSMNVEDLCHADEPTGHRGVMDGETYHFVCFYDAVVLAALADEPVDVRTESPGGVAIEAQAAGSDEVSVSPSDAVFSIGVASEAAPSGTEPTIEEVYGAVCPYVKAFPDRDAYEDWADDVPAATVAIPFGDAAAVAEALAD